jgi:hypothetical protein
MGDLVLLAAIRSDVGERPPTDEEHVELLLEWRMIGEAMSPADLSGAAAEMRRTLRARTEAAVLPYRRGAIRRCVSE